jgi:hypothetical protein
MVNYLAMCERNDLSHPYSGEHVLKMIVKSLKYRE